MAIFIRKISTLITNASLFTLFVSSQTFAGEMMSMSAHPTGPADCSEMEIWDYASAMCQPRAMKDMPMSMVMFHANAFAVQNVSEGPRGHDAFSLPNMFMVDAGRSVGDAQYFNIEFMGTLERWTFQKAGYPLLMQIGEENEDHQAYIDSQHPHSSPVMGLTLSDTISFGSGTDFAKIWFAPRGQSTDGPIAFMHRPTGMMNPDAPLGHHIGQDAGHITSTVVGSSLRINNSNLEASTFYGSEPQPAEVDLPMSTPNSYAFRLTQSFGPHFYGMTSAAFVKNPESHDPDLDHIWRYSASIYSDVAIASGWTWNNALIWGLINDYDHTAALSSFGEEFWFRRDAHSIWGRIEYVERNASELAIASSEPLRARWVSAWTLGATERLADYAGFELSVGGSLTKDFLPGEWRRAYGGDPLTAKIFLQLGGMVMHHQ